MLVEERIEYKGLVIIRPMNCKFYEIFTGYGELPGFGPCMVDSVAEAKEAVDNLINHWKNENNKRYQN